MFKRMLFALAVICGMNFVGFADELLDVCFQFQTLGDDCYADGSMLEEGECYALVWRHNDLASSIKGLFDNTGAPVQADKCEILGVFNTAAWSEDPEKPGHWYASATNSWMILPRGHYAAHNANGVYSVLVFDTRTWDGSKWTLGGKTSDKTVASLRRYGLVTDLEDIKLGTGAGGSFFSYNVGMYGTAFVGNAKFTSTGDVSTQYSCADTPVACPVSFYIDDETVFEKKMFEIDQPIGELPTPDAREGYLFVGWFTTGGDQVTPQTTVTSGMKLMAQWEAAPVREPVFSSVSIANGKAILNVTNTLPSLRYGISWVTSVAEVFSKTNWVSDVKDGEKDAQTPLMWTIDLKGAPQGFFRVLPVK